MHLLNMSFLSFQAKSEAQLASEKAWLSAEKVWLVHKGGFTGASAITSEADSELPEGRCKVKIDYNGKILEVDEEDVEKVGICSIIICHQSSCRLLTCLMLWAVCGTVLYRKKNLSANLSSYTVKNRWL